MKTMNQLLIPFIVSTLMMPLEANAYHCFITLVKDSCWTNYDVSVNMRDASTGKSVTNVSIPKGKSWTRQPFECEASQGLDFSATFSPVFWQSDKGKHYSGTKTWTLPSSMNKGDTAWNVTICYPEGFAEVPLPPTAGSHCTCDTKSLPPVEAPKSAS